MVEKLKGEQKLEETVERARNESFKAEEGQIEAENCNYVDPITAEYAVRRDCMVSASTFLAEELEHRDTTTNSRLGF